MTSGNYWYYNIIQDENNRKENNQKNLLKQKVILRDKTLKESIGYDKEGRVVDYKTTKNREVKINYYKDDFKQELFLFRKNKLVKRDSFLWDDKKLLKCFYFNKNNKIVSQESYKYDSTFVTEYIYQKIKSEKIIEKRKRTTEYYPDYSIKKITYYKNGKPDFYSVFDCNPIGENHKIKKDSAYSCEKYDLDSLGNKIRVTITNEKHMHKKVITYFNKKDEVIATKTYTIPQNELVWTYYYMPGTYTIIKFISYSNKKEFYRIENTYDDKNKDNCIEWVSYRHGRLKHKMKNTFNQKGLIEKSVFSNRWNKNKTESTYLYEYYF